MNTLKFVSAVVVALFALIQLMSPIIHAGADEVQYCYGKNISDTIKDKSLFMCPFAHFMDEDQGRCISYGEVISKFINVKCQRDSDCADDTNSFFVCENKKCVYYGTRALGDSCEGDKHCRGYTTGGSIVCHARTKKCATIQEEYTATENALCGYSDGSAIVMCKQPDYECAYTNYPTTLTKRCKVLKKLDEVCMEGKTMYNCRNGTAGETLICYPDSSGTTAKCRTKLNQGEMCVDNSYCKDGLRCDSSVTPPVCIPLKASGEECTYSEECQNGLSCAHPKFDFPRTQKTICQPRRVAGEECSTLSCSLGLTCISGICRAGDLNDPCYAGSCKLEYACGPQNLCMERVVHDKPCNSTVEDNCQADSYCRSETYLCQKYAKRNEECNDKDNLRCMEDYSCSRGRCIVPYSIANGGRCASDSDCSEGYCDEYLMVCSNRKRCLKNISGCSCICSKGKSDFGTCFSTNLCRKYITALDECYPSLESSEYMWLDTGSSIFKKCKSQFQDYVRCQAKIYKIAAPFSPLRAIPGYNLEGISAASSYAVSALAVAVSIVSYLFMM